MLTATGGLTGRYVLSGDTHVSAFFDVVDHYDANHAYLDVSQTHAFREAGVTRNQIAAATASDTGTGDLFSAIAYLPTFMAAQGAFDQISGEIKATAAGAGVEDSRFVREAVIDRLRADPHSDTTDKMVWGRAFGSTGNFDGDGNAAHLDRSIGGLFVGADMFGSENWRGGVVGGFSSSDLKVKERASKATATDLTAGVYGGSQSGAWKFRFGGDMTFRHVSTDRSVDFPGFSDRLKGHYDSQVGQAFAEAGYSTDMGLEPFADLAVVNIHTGQNDEHGGAAALSENNLSQSVIFSTVGVRGTGSFKVGDTMLNLNGSLGLRHANGDVTPTASVAFTGGGPDVIVAGVPIAKNVAAVDFGIDTAMGAKGTFNLSYSGQYAKGVTDHGVKATMLWKF